LGVDALNESALGRLVDLKVRNAHKPISVLVSDDRMLNRLVEAIPTKARVLIDRFWPGPLTMVFAARPGLPAALTAGTGSIAARVSSHPTAQALVAALGRPLTSPSANPAGQPPPKRIADARAYFGERVDCYLDAGALPGEPASTVVDVRGDLRLVRPGAIDFEILQNVQGTD
jgi:L-threonylcarbamoyladenylate synthase